jgi:phosphate transport system substrate-binding protein
LVFFDAGIVRHYVTHHKWELGVVMLKSWRVALFLLATMSMSLVISACGGGSSSNSSSSGGSSSSAPTTLGTPGVYNCVQGQITASGSTALAPLVKAVAAKYTAKCQGASITVNLGGSGTGLGQVFAGSVNIGNSDIFAKPTQTGLVDHQVAVVVFAVIVNSNVGVKSLTTAQLQGIYSGKYSNWSQVGGPNQKIVVVSRPASSGTRATFQQYVIGGPETISGSSSLTTDSTSTVIQNVAQNPGAIGYAATGPVKKASGVSIVSIDGSAPEDSLVQNNTYKFWGFEHMYTKGTPKPLAQALIDYMASSDGTQEGATLGFLPTSSISASAAAAHQPKQS